MRRVLLAFITFLALSLAGAAANAEDITIDVAVDVAGLAPEVRDVTTECQVCTVDCEKAKASQVLGTNAKTQSFAPGGSPGLQSTMTVVVSTKSTRAAEFMCLLKIGDGKDTFLAGTGPEWTIPAPGSAFQNKVKGKIPAAVASTDELPPCKAGLVRINGKCTQKITKAPTCPDGSPKPANGNCGFAGPMLDILPGIFNLLNRPAETNNNGDGGGGNVNGGNYDSRFYCADGSPKPKTGVCR